MVMILLTEDIKRTEFLRPGRDTVSQSSVCTCGGAGQIAQQTAKGRLSISRENVVPLHTDQTQNGDSSIALRILYRGPRRGRVVSAKLRLLCLRGTDPLPTVHEAGWASKSVWMGPENIAHIELRTTDSTARDRSLQRLRFPGKQCQLFYKKIRYFKQCVSSRK